MADEAVISAKMKLAAQLAGRDDVLAVGIGPIAPPAPPLLVLAVFHTSNRPPPTSSGNRSPRAASSLDRCAQLDAALAAITLAITNCVFPLAVPPLDPGFVGVTVDGQLIPRDPTHSQGWDYRKGVEIFGSECTDLKNGTALSVGVHFGCPK